MKRLDDLLVVKDLLDIQSIYNTHIASIRASKILFDDDFMDFNL